MRLKTLIEVIARQLYDESFDNWTDKELVRWVEEALETIATVRPDLVGETEEFQLEKGVRQKIPDSAARLVALLGVKDEEGDDGIQSDVTLFDVRAMRAAHPKWQLDPPSVFARQYAFAENDRRAFYVYPPQPDPAGYAVAEVVPAFDLPAPDDDKYNGHEVGLDGRYMRALVDYALYRAYSKDIEAAANAERAQLHFRQFFDALGAGQQQQEGGDERSD